MDLTIKWVKEDKTWGDFDLDSILHMPVRHACHLFSNKIPILAKQGEVYITNTQALVDKCRKEGKKVTTFEKILETGGEKLDKALEVGGFLT